MKTLIFGAGSDMTPAIRDIYPDAVLLTHEDCDVTFPKEVDEAMTVFKPEVVINLAGISHLQPLKGAEVFDWWDEVETNLVGSFIVARYSIKHKVKKMIFIGSVAGFHGKANHSGYCASKAGVHSLIQSLAAEGYEAYGIAPGRVNTKLREQDFPGEDPRTRLTTAQVATVVREIVEDKYNPGDIVVLRKVGYDTRQWTYDGQPWRKDLKITPWEAPSGY